MNKRSQAFAQRLHEEEPDVDIPPHLEWDWETLEGEYKDICDHQHFGLHVDAYHIMAWCTGDDGLRQRHIRYQPGTNEVIKKGYRGGRIRPTPENVINQK